MPISWVLMGFLLADAGARDKILQVDHSRAQVCVLDPEGNCAAEDWREIDLRTSASLTVKVVNTSTALYTFSISSKRVEVKEIEGLKDFLTLAGPYLIELGHAAAEAMRAAEQRRQAAIERRPTNVESALRDLDAAYNGLRGIRDMAACTTAALREMSIHAGDSEITAESLKRYASIPPEVGTDRCPFLLPTSRSGCRPPARPCSSPADSFVRERLVAVDRLASALDDLRIAVHQPDAGVPEDTLNSARDLVAKTEETMASARRLEDLFNLAIDARSCWLSSPFKVSFREGVDITLKISPRERAELAPLAFRSTEELKASVRPDNIIRPALALSLLASSKAKYPVYGALKEGDTFKVAQTGTTDARFVYGLTLGMTWRGLDWRRGSNLAVWFPEFTINPVKDERSFGLGGALSWKIFKFGAGRVWTKHKDLDGQKPGDVLPDKDSLRLRDVYGTGKLYFNVSVFGWPPFLPK